jgi:hypothetical protein
MKPRHVYACPIPVWNREHIHLCVLYMR